MREMKREKHWKHGEYISHTIDKIEKNNLMDSSEKWDLISKKPHTLHHMYKNILVRKMITYCKVSMCSYKNFIFTHTSVKCSCGLTDLGVLGSSDKLHMCLIWAEKAVQCQSGIGIPTVHQHSPRVQTHHVNHMH